MLAIVCWCLEKSSQCWKQKFMNKNNGSVEPPSMAEDSSASAPESKQPTLLTQILSEDPFDLENIRLDQSKMNAPAAKKLLIKIPVRKPNRQDWIRVNPQLSICAALIDHKETRDQYLVQAKLAPYVEQESYRATLYLTMNRQGVAFFWPVRLPEDGRSNDWNENSRVAAEEAVKNWVRVMSN